MKRDDVIAADLLRGRVSDSERELVGHEPEGFDRVTLETFLYEHLNIAARARMRMDAAKAWSTDYHLDYRTREIAIEAASRHYRALLEMGGEIEPLLAQMALNEGLTP